MFEADLVRAAIFPVMVAGAVVIWRAGRRVPGRLLVLIGTLHLAGLWVGRDPLRRILAGGFFNQADSALAHIPAKTDQELVFWFGLWGLLIVLIGQLVIVLERQNREPPAWFGWQLIALNVVCGVLMPKAGFWWVLLPGWLIARGRQDAGDTAA